jgi:hypothetical protein
LFSAASRRHLSGPESTPSIPNMALPEGFWIVNSVAGSLRIGDAKRLAESKEIVYIQPVEGGEKPPQDANNNNDANDRLTGGAGADQFAFSNTPSGTTHVDAVMDFELGVDKIVLDVLAFGSLAGSPAGALAAGNFVSGASAQDADDHILYDTTTHVLSYDADGSGSGAAQQIAVLENGADLSASDILLV